MMKTFPPNRIDWRYHCWKNLQVIGLWRTHIDSGVNAAFNACTLQSNSQGTASCFLDLCCLLLGCCVWGNKHGAYTWDQLLRKVQTGLEKVSNDDRFGPSSSSRKKCGEADRTRAAVLHFSFVHRISLEWREMGYYQIRRESPSRRPDRSIPARATARGSHNEPSSKETLSGRRWSHWAGWRCHLVRVPNIPMSFKHKIS